MKAVPLNQKVKSRHRKGQASFEGWPNAMQNLLEMADSGRKATRQSPPGGNVDQGIPPVTARSNIAANYNGWG
jgi:hypothetical protein